MSLVSEQNKHSSETTFSHIQFNSPPQKENKKKQHDRLTTAPTQEVTRHSSARVELTSPLAFIDSRKNDDSWTLPYLVTVTL